MKRPNFKLIFTNEDEFCEKSSDIPVDSFVPGQAMNLGEMISRFERGQRLNIHSNFPAGDNFTNGSIYEESFDDAPPDDVHDIVDVKVYYDEHNVHKREFAEKHKVKVSTPKKEESKEAEQPSDAPEDTSN